LPAAPLLTSDLFATCSNAVRGATPLTDTEDALRPLTELAKTALGDHRAPRPGALKEGERDYRVSGIFVVTPDNAYNMLVAADGFPPEQRRLSIPIAWSHPGQVVATRQAILLRNIDDHPDFRQFLRTSRMGSSIYAPIFLGETLIAQFVAAAQARDTYDAPDLDALRLLAATAAVIWRTTGGTDWLQREYPAPDMWRAEDHSKK
jgi:putative methionine-R-sulfoxide reductase with GAF domain